jgi:hypothetical protein
VRQRAHVLFRLVMMGGTGKAPREGAARWEGAGAGRSRVRSAWPDSKMYESLKRQGHERGGRPPEAFT